MSSQFTHREKACFMAGVDWRGWRPISGVAIEQSMTTAGLKPEPRETQAELEANRFAHYLVGNRAFRDNSIIKLEMRAVSGDDPTLDEWRAAIDKSILAAAKCKVLVD